MSVEVYEIARRARDRLMEAKLTEPNSWINEEGFGFSVRYGTDGLRIYNTSGAGTRAVKVASEKVVDEFIKQFKLALQAEVETMRKAAIEHFSAVMAKT